ncbi:MAG: hypothetical protein VX944_14585 [Myxococcota bacterium]|nr:hypothetical protein [Myxococcota bacterium]
MPGIPPMIGHARVLAASLIGMMVPWVFGPDDGAYRMFALSLGILTLLGGIIRSRTNEGGLVGDLATGALALLMLAPAVGVRRGRVADAIFTATHVSPHDALYQLPAITQTVPDAAGPLLVGAGLAMVAVAGRLGAVYSGIAFGAAIASWMGHTLAIEAGEAMRAERFEDAVVYAQAMRFVGLTVAIGAVAGFPFYRRGKVEWRAALHRVLHEERVAAEQARRDEEIARLAAAQAEQRAREAALEAKQARDQAETEKNQGVTIAELDPIDETLEESPAPHDGQHRSGEGGGFGEEDGDIASDDDANSDDDADADADDAKARDGDDASTERTESEDTTPADDSVAVLPELELEPRFDVEAPIVVSVEPEESNPDAGLDGDTVRRMRTRIGGLMIIAALAAGWTSTPPWFEVLSALPDPGTTVAVPSTEPGPSIARTPMDPLHREFDAHLEQRGHARLHGAPWSCLNDTANFGSQYGTLDRGVEVMALPSDTPMVDLYEAVTSMRQRGVYRMGLTGRADPPYGPLGALFAWPAVQVLLDRPPRAAQWMVLKPRSLEELPLVPGRGAPRSCVLLIDETVKVNHVYNTVRSLSSVYGDKRCELGIALVFPDDGTTTNANPAWRGCP